MKTQSFSKKAKTTLIKICQARLHALRHVRSKSPATWDECKKVFNDITLLQSNRQVSDYIIENFELLNKIALPSLKPHLTELKIQAMLGKAFYHDCKCS